MDLDIGEKVATPDEIPANLNKKGWNIQEVSRVWRAASLSEHDKSWTHESLKILGGNDVLVDTWSRLKADKLTGFPKRSAPRQFSGQNKRLRTQPAADTSDYSDNKVSNVSSLSPISSAIPVDVLRDGSACLLSSPLNAPLIESKQKRKVARPRRQMGPKQKITWWFQQQPTTPSQPPKSPAVAAVEDGSPDMFLQTPRQETPRKRRRPRRPRKGKDPATPSALQPSTEAPEDSPSFNLKRRQRKPHGSKKTPSVPKAKPTFSTCVAAAVDLNLNGQEMELLDNIKDGSLNLSSQHSDL